MSDLLFVCAGNHRQAVEYAISQDVPQARFRYVNSIEKIRGFRGITLVATGTYYENPCFSEIRQECEIRDIEIDYK